MLLTNSTARSLASLITLTDKGGVPAWMGLVHITATDSTLTALATDRYVVGEATYEGEFVAGEYYMNAAAAAAMSKAKHGVELEAGDGVTIWRVDGATFEVMNDAGRFATLPSYLEASLTAVQESTAALNLVSLARFGKILDASPKPAKVDTWQVALGGLNERGKPLPALLSPNVATRGVKFRGVIQPNMGRA